MTVVRYRLARKEDIPEIADVYYESIGARAVFCV